ncbi:hypothetical protein AAWM_05854 [Aspergillus awamori]|uniref:Alpha-L-rhamnosidase C-terminal domain-containing protein n=1 Tax=Aspergillus awamori TaxID=105351 RepID=A0A401KUQ8_ASPAW|nr:hypothetical protein AAWM_05854 [Aspergillus awamori]GKZ53092.1 hypothetical protein AnigIFM49718_005671 [Aspergillus niger]
MRIYLGLALLVPSVVCGALYAPSSQPTYQRKTYTLAAGDPLPVSNGTVYKLSSNGSSPAIVILDYGKDVEGYATFEVTRQSGDTSCFEMSYGETREAMDLYMADGPIPFSAAMDTYRINRYNISQPTVQVNRLIQGGLRYQKLNLSSAGELEIKALGFKPTVDSTPVSHLPGSFACSDPALSRIWNVGARTVQLNEFPANSLPNFWVISDEGAFIDSLSPQPFAADYAAMLTAYELDFTVKPVKNGFGFTVLSDTLGNGIYILVNVANSSISAYVGPTEVGSPVLASAVLPFPVTLNNWHTVESTVNLTQISVMIDGAPVFNFTQNSAFYGSFGLGASFQQAAVFTNVSLTVSGTQMYSSSLSDESALQDFLVGTNPLPVSVDGSRRDRIAYGGDLDITTSSSFASTYGREYINGTITLLGSARMLPGFFMPNVKVQQPPRTSDIQANITGLISYSFNLVSAMAQYYEQTGDSVFLSKWAPKAAGLLDWAHSQTLPNGLFNISNPIFGGDWNHYDPSVSGIVSKFNLVYAYALNQWLPIMTAGGLNATLYASRLRSLQNAINSELWSDSLQAYYLSDSHRDFFSQEANALAILSGTASFGPEDRTQAILASMSRELYVPAGALSFSNKSAAYGWAQKISPYASGYHLKAAFQANDSANAKRLLYSLWGPMSDPAHKNYTGCYWEVLDSDGTPGLDIGTSLCHAWSAGPTADLSRFILGVQPVTPGFRQWQVAPQSFELGWAEGKYPTPQGALSVKWSFGKNGFVQMQVNSPSGTNGTVYLPQPLQKEIGSYNVSGGVPNGKGGFIVQGTNFTFRQTS